MKMDFILDHGKACELNSLQRRNVTETKHLGDNTSCRNVLSAKQHCMCCLLNDIRSQR